MSLNRFGPGDWLYEAGSAASLWYTHTSGRVIIMLSVGPFSASWWPDRCKSEIGWVLGPLSGHWIRGECAVLNCGRASLQWRAPRQRSECSS